MFTSSILKLKPPGRRGMSLIETLVVIAIISLLVGLLIPSIQAARNAAGRAQNVNNIKHILIAVHNYAAQNNGNWPGDGNWQGGWLNSTVDIIHTPYGDICSSGCLVLSSNNNGSGPCKTDVSGDCLEDPAKAQTDWIDGGTIFQLLLYTDYANVYQSSYGPMWDGVDQSHVTSKLNFGWQAGRNPTPIKSFLGIGDPTTEYPGVIAPMSYALLGGVGGGGSLEQVETSNTAFIAESYAACGVGQPFVGTYGSYAGGVYYDGSSGLYPINAAAAFPPQLTFGSTLFWLAPGEQCPTQYRSTLGQNQTCMKPGSCPPPAIPCDPNGDNRPECHQGEQYYRIGYNAVNHHLFDDDPHVCEPGIVHSLVRGTLDIGYLDGSVRRLNAGADYRLIDAIQTGAPMNLDPNDF